MCLSIHVRLVKGNGGCGVPPPRHPRCVAGAKTKTTPRASAVEWMLVLLTPIPVVGAQMSERRPIHTGAPPWVFGQSADAETRKVVIFTRTD